MTDVPLPKAGAIRAHPVAVPQGDLDDLRTRLARTRWPEAETVSNWSQGAPLEAMRALCGDWAERYDWRAVEAELNAADSSMIEIDGLDIHFLYRRSKHPKARPVLLLHGWPGSVIEFLDCLPALTDPAAHGGAAEHAFHAVIPSLPGFGFSGKPSETGWGVDRIADAFAALMDALGHDRFIVQGGDWGSEIAVRLLDRHPARCTGAHLNFVVSSPPKEVVAAPTKAEAAQLARLEAYRKRGQGYLIQQATKPQTLGYGLTDSPAGQAAWIYEKLHDADAGKSIRRERALDIVSHYWLSASAVSSARLYWESIAGGWRDPVIGPVACSIFPHEIHRPSRRWAENRFRDIRHWSEPARGGHFAALEQPEIFVRELRAAVAALPEQARRGDET